MKQKKADNIVYYDVLATPVGTLYLMFSSALLTGILFERPVNVPLKKTDETEAVKKELAEYFEKGRRDFSCKTAFSQGTDFERLVWHSLREIPFAETRTYKWMAERVGHPTAFRAVGNALGKNPIPIIFPCHRVIESDGSLGGYSGGEEIKRRLLEFEYYSKLSGS